MMLSATFRRRRSCQRRWVSRLYATVRLLYATVRLYDCTTVRLLHITTRSRIADKDMQVLNFECRPSLYHFTDLSTSTLELTLRVVNRDGSELEGPANLTCSCLARQQLRA